MTRCIQALHFHRFADFNYIAGANTAAHIGNGVGSVLMRNDTGACCGYHRFVATRVVAMFMGIEDLRDGPAVLLRDRQALLVVQRVNRQRVTGLRANDKVIKIAIGIACPDLFNDHSLPPQLLQEHAVDIMSKLLVIRHGQARLFTDNYDRLSELGVRQAERLGEWFVQRGIVLDEIYAGTLKRQQETANAVSEVMLAAGNEIPELKILEGLNEYPAEEIMKQLVPALRGSDSEIDHLAEEYDQADDFDTRYRSLHQLLAIIMERWIKGDYEQDESLMTWTDFSGAVRTALADAMRTSGSGKTVAVFTSGGPIGVSVQTALDAPDLKAAELNWRIHNCSVTRFTFSGERVSMDAFNETAHLPQDMLTFR